MHGSKIWNLICLLCKESRNIANKLDFVSWMEPSICSEYFFSYTWSRFQPPKEWKVNKMNWINPVGTHVPNCDFARGHRDVCLCVCVLILHSYSSSAQLHEVSLRSIFARSARNSLILSRFRHGCNTGTGIEIFITGLSCFCPGTNFEYFFQLMAFFRTLIFLQKHVAPFFSYFYSITITLTKALFVTKLL